VVTFGFLVATSGSLAVTSGSLAATSGLLAATSGSLAAAFDHSHSTMATGLGPHIVAVTAAVTAEIAPLASAPTVSFAALRNPPAALLDFFEIVQAGLLAPWPAVSLSPVAASVEEAHREMGLVAYLCFLLAQLFLCWKPSLPAAGHYSYYSVCEKATSEDRAPQIPDTPLHLRAMKLPLSVSLNGNKQSDLPRAVEANSGGGCR
jgi:hypothetical protein